MKINVIGAGLAGCEAAYQIAKTGIKVNLYDMKPNKKSPAHNSSNLAELVCSNSLKANYVESAAGLLKEELRALDSLLIRCADKTSVPAGGALAVDRDKFSAMVSEEIKNNPNIEIIHEEVTEIPKDNVTIVATGPLTSDSLSESISKEFNNSLSFYDAAAPIVTYESIDLNKAFFASRYNKGDTSDYLNCPLNVEEYNLFYNELVNAERAPLHNVDVRNPKVYEGCMPIEILAQRGKDTMRYGPMKPVGLEDPTTNKRPWAVVQLRKENSKGTMYNLVGFQTNLKFPEQKRVFGLIPALKNAEYVRYGVMHRNTFIDSPRILTSGYNTVENKNLYFAGQITGVEGYVESISSGLAAGINAARQVKGNETITFPLETIIGSLSLYISDETVVNFQPMSANFGILPKHKTRIRNKRERGAAHGERSLNILNSFIKEKGLS